MTRGPSRVLLHQNIADQRAQLKGLRVDLREAKKSVTKVKRELKKAEALVTKLERTIETGKQALLQAGYKR